MYYDVGLTEYSGKWTGHTAYIIGCGPSLLNWAPDFLEKQKTIAVNSSAYYFKPSYRIFFDRGNFSKDLPSVHHFTTRCWLQNRKKLSRVERERMDEISWTFFDVTPRLCIAPPDKITELWGPTTFAAISLALVMGAITINLIGIDFGSINKKTHWDGNRDALSTNELGVRQQTVLSNTILPYFKKHDLKINFMRSP